MLRERAGDERGNVFLPRSSTWFFWKQFQAMANKTSFRKNSLYRTTEPPHLPTDWAQPLFPNQRCDAQVSVRPFSSSAVRVLGQQNTAVSPRHLLPALLRLSPLLGQSLPAHIYSSPERNTQHPEDQHSATGTRKPPQNLVNFLTQDLEKIEDDVTRTPD